jgi:hypothetical protein
MSDRPHPQSGFPQDLTRLNEAISPLPQQPHADAAPHSQDTVGTTPGSASYPADSPPGYLEATVWIRTGSPGSWLAIVAVTLESLYGGGTRCSFGRVLGRGDG